MKSMRGGYYSQISLSQSLLCLLWVLNSTSHSKCIFRSAGIAAAHCIFKVEASHCWIILRLRHSETCDWMRQLIRTLTHCPVQLRSLHLLAGMLATSTLTILFLSLFLASSIPYFHNSSPTLPLLFRSLCCSANTQIITNMSCRLSAHTHTHAHKWRQICVVCTVCQSRLPDRWAAAAASVVDCELVNKP